MAAAFDLASDFELAPQALRDKSKRVGLPFSSRSGPGIPPIRAKNDARRGLSPDFTGAFRFIPSAFADARPLAFKPPFGFLPSDLCQAGLATGRPHIVYQVGVWTTSLFSRPHRVALFSRAKLLGLIQIFWAFFIPDLLIHISFPYQPFALQ
jgi:hypothetical protein